MQYDALIKNLKKSNLSLKRLVVAGKMKLKSFYLKQALKKNLNL